jgi:hypothetical protein
VTDWIGRPVPGGGVTARKAKSRFGSRDCFQPAATVMLWTAHDPYGLTHDQISYDPLLLRSVCQEEAKAGPLRAARLWSAVTH